MGEINQHVFRTVIQPTEYDFKLTYKSKSIFIGSCFSENIGNLLGKYKFSVDINPFGILFNPISVANCLKFLLNKRRFVENDLVFHNEHWHSFYHHGRFSGTSKEEVIDCINKRIKNPIVEFSSTDYLFITFGTAWVYELKETGMVVSNCHKFPNKMFTKKLIAINETVDLYLKIFDDFFESNPGIQVLFSLSPVRHIKDGFQENSLSKSILRVIIDELVQKYKNVHYFPAFEIVNDDLRDYRFYAEDMVHPNDSSIRYIFNYFSNCFFDIQTCELLSRIKNILKASEHIPYSIETKSYKEFKIRILNEIKMLSDKHSYIDLKEEIKCFK